MPGYELFGKEEQKEVQDILETGILMRYNFDAPRKGHWKSKELEKNIQEKLNAKYVHLTSSGTTALVTALKALGVGAGDEVIMPSFTFVASFEAIIFSGAIPIIVDIDDTLTISPKAIENAITPRTKVIMPVHMCGAMADMDSIISIAKKHNLIVLEDACQATGATYKGKYLGTIGDIGCYSFDFVKTVTCGEGGAVITNSKELYHLSDQYTDHGHDHFGKDRGAENHPILGLNFRMNEMNAAVGLAQWRKLDDILAKQRSIKKQIKEILKQESAITFRRILDEEGDNASFVSIFLPSEEVARKTSESLKKSEIPHAHYIDNNWHYIKKWEHLKNYKHTNQLYSEQRELLPDYANQDFSVSDELVSKSITFPISLLWTENDVRKKANTILEAVRENL